MEEITSIFDNLDEWLNDENRIITYRWLSLTLNLHVNFAKHVLEEFVKLERSKNHTLSVTYCLAGIISQDGDKVYKLIVIPEEDRDTIAATMLQPVSCHVYSVQKSPVKSADVLHMADYDLTKSSGALASQFSAVQCPAAAKARVRTERSSHSSQEVNGAVSSTSSPAIGVSVPPKSAVQSKAAEKTSTAKGSSGIGQLFANAAKKKTETKATEVAKSSKSPAVSAKDNVASAMASGDTKATKPVASSDKSKSHAVKSNEASSKTSKRRRIVELSSSDEEDAVSLGAPSPEPPSPPPEPQVEPMDVSEPDAAPQADSGSHQVMRRKLVSKTYVNDEGFMVTEKVWENEIIVEPNDSNKPAAAPAHVSAPAPASSVTTKKQPNKKTSQPAACQKQASLTKFFQKK